MGTNSRLLHSIKFWSFHQRSRCHFSIDSALVVNYCESLNSYKNCLLRLCNDCDRSYEFCTKVCIAFNCKMEHISTLCSNTYSGLHINLFVYATMYIRFSNNTVGVRCSYSFFLYTYLSSVYSHWTVTWLLALRTDIHWQTNVLNARGTGSVHSTAIIVFVYKYSAL